MLTPAVFAAAQAAEVENKLPYLFICATVANAASFVLPISNPANLVLYASRTPPLLTWLGQYALPSLLSIVATFVVLRATQGRALRQPIATDIEQPALSRGGRLAAIGICLTAIVLLVSSGVHIQLGLPTATAGIVTAVVVLALNREAPWGMLRGISWAVLPLVAGLFVLVEGVGHTGIITQLADLLRRAAAGSATQTGAAAAPCWP